MSNAIEDLKGDNPKIMGFDYYNIIYAACAGLIGSMIVVYFIVDDPKVRGMVLTQGTLSICLVCALTFYRYHLDKQNLALKVEVDKNLEADKKNNKSQAQKKKK